VIWFDDFIKCAPLFHKITSTNAEGQTASLKFCRTQICITKKQGHQLYSLTMLAS